MKHFRNVKEPRNESATSQPRRSFRWLIFGLLAAIAAPAMSADVDFIAVLKGQRFEQTGPTLVILREEDDSDDDEALALEAFAIGASSNSLVSGTLQIPGGTTVPLERWDTGDSEILHEYQTDTLLDLNTTRSNGTYTLDLITQNDGTQQIPLNLLGDAYPNVPVVTNFNALQTITHTNATVVHWATLTGGTTNDFIQFVVYDNETDQTVYESDGPGAPGSLNGTSVQTTIPADLLDPGRTYEAEVLFVKVVDINFTSYPGVLAIAGYYKQTGLLIQTVALPGQELGAQFEYSIPQSWGGDVPRDSAISFRFSQPMTTNYTLVSWTNVSSANFTYEWLDGNTVLLCRYNTALPADTEVGWSLDLSGFRDAANFPLTGSVEGSFHTSSDDPQSPPDVTWFSVLKMRGYQQTGITPVSSGMYGCEAEIEMAAYNRVKQGTLTIDTNGRSGFLMADENDPEMWIEATYASETDIERFFANGDFTFDLTTLADGAKTLTLSLGATNDYPAAPTATNLEALQTIDPDTPVTVQWTAPANWSATPGIGNCVVELEIDNSQGDEVLWVDNEEITSGSQYTIPANTLWPGRTYDVSIYFIKIKDVDDTSYLDAIGVAGFSSTTEFTLQTTGTVIMPTAAIEPDENDNMNLSITGGEPQRGYVGETSPDLTRWRQRGQTPSRRRCGAWRFFFRPVQSRRSAPEFSRRYLPDRSPSPKGRRSCRAPRRPEFPMFGKWRPFR